MKRKPNGFSTIAPEILALAEQAKSIYEAQPKVFVSCPNDALAILLADALVEERECLWVLALNSRNRVVAKEQVYRGSLATNLVRLAEVFRLAIVLNAHAIIVAHNHPSGDPSPSPEDLNMTKAMVEAGRILDVELLDHLVIGASGAYVSMKSKGLGF